MKEYTTWIELDTNSLNNNISQIKNLVVAKKISAVVKSNAYGHGMLELAPILENSSAIYSFSVFSLNEALSLRRIGIKKPILVFGVWDAPFEDALKNNIDLALFDMAYAHELNKIASDLNLIANIHVKIDTGLSRLGFLWDFAVKNILEISKLKNLKIVGIFSHFAESDLEDETFTILQTDRLIKIINELKKLGLEIPLKHIQNSSAAIRFAKSSLFDEFNMIRIGGSILGLLKPYIKKIKPDDLNLKEIFTWKSRLIQIKDISAGSYVSYARTYQVKQNTKIGIVPVGYSDGYDRRFSNSGEVLINDKKANVLGRVCMNAIIVDLNNNCDAKIGDEVILLKDNSEINPDNLADKLSTINYELLTRINKDIPRILI